jgi:hypothetical protein
VAEPCLALAGYVPERPAHLRARGLGAAVPNRDVMPNKAIPTHKPASPSMQAVVSRAQHGPNWWNATLACGHQRWMSQLTETARCRECER